MTRLSLKIIMGMLAVALGGLGQANAQEKVVSLGGDMTEIIYALGEQERIVATDTTSVFPPSALLTPKVGYLRNLSAEGVLSMQPDMILVSGAAGPEAAVELIRSTGVPIVEMEKAYTIESIIAKTRAVAEVFGTAEKGEEIVAQIETDWAEAQTVIDQLDDAPRVLFFSTISDGTPSAAGTDTAAQGVIDLLGGVNVFGDRSGYKPISLEAAVAADPDIILVMNFSAARMGGIEGVAQQPAIAMTSAASEGRIFMVDAVRVMQFSPRTPKAMGELAEEIQARLSGADG